MNALMLEFHNGEINAELKLWLAGEFPSQSHPIHEIAAAVTQIGIAGHPLGTILDDHPGIRCRRPVCRHSWCSLIAQVTPSRARPTSNHLRN